MSNFNKRSLVAAWLGIASLSLVGCAKSPELKTASGKPVEFWVEALKAPNTDAKQRLKAVKTLCNVGPAQFFSRARACASTSAALARNTPWTA